MKKFPYLFLARQCLSFMVTLQALSAAPPAARCDFLETFEHAKHLDGLDAWSLLHFPNIREHSVFSIKNTGNNSYLYVESIQSSSGLMRPCKLRSRDDLCVQWRWRVDELPNKQDDNETRKEGDDFPLRVMVLFQENSGHGMHHLRLPHFTQKIGSALCYVWANRLAADTVFQSPASSSIAVLAVKTGTEWLGIWCQESRVLAVDYTQAFAQHMPDIVGIVIMADTDNTHSASKAGIDDIVIFQKSG